MAVQEFRAVTIQPAGLRGLGAGFKAGGEFIVRARFDQEDASRYEYRQYIKGTATLTMGQFGAGAPSRANWHATQPPHNAANDFQIPGGLRPTFTEDGQTANGRTERYGYRNAMPVMKGGLEDRYMPDQKMGHEYRLRDKWGLSGRSRPRGLHVQLDITYKGVIIDNRDGNREVRQLTWRVQVDDIIT